MGGPSSFRCDYAPVTAPLQDDDSLEWEATTKRQELVDNEVMMAAPRTSNVSLTMNQDSATVAITKLAQSMVKHQEAQLEVQKEKGDSRLKAWKKLPRIQQNITLPGGISEDGGIQEQATEEMLSILGCQNGA